jgi:D-amino-acid dehydrogenase
MSSHITPDLLTTKPNTKPASRKITVLGAGIVGIASALYLQRDGHSVTVIDQQGPGEGCSKGNAGILATEYMSPLATPKTMRQVPRMLLDPRGPLCIRWRYLPRLLPWLLRFMACARPKTVAANGRALAALLTGSLDAYWPLLDQAGAHPLVHANGWVYAYESEKSFVADRKERELQRQHGTNVKELTDNELHELVPALSPHLRRGSLYPDAAHSVNSFRLVQVLAEDFQRRGGLLRRAIVTDVDVRDQHRIRVLTDAGPYETDTLLIALGAWSGKLAARLGSRVPLDTERGYHVMLPNPNIKLKLPISFTEYKFVATPMEHGLRLAGTVELAGLNAPPNYKRAQVLLDHARELLPGLDAAGHTTWMGFRPSLPDSLPVIGRSPHHANVYFAFGHQHLGLTLAAVTGRLVADQIADRASNIDLAPYRIDRF